MPSHRINTIILYNYIHSANGLPYIYKYTPGKADKLILTIFEDIHENHSCITEASPDKYLIYLYYYYYHYYYYLYLIITIIKYQWSTDISFGKIEGRQ